MQTPTFEPSQLHHAFTLSNGKTLKYCSLPALKNIGIDSVSRLPISIRIILESLIRNTDNHRITFEHVQQLANWQPNAARNEEIPFMVARVVLQDFTGVPLLCDLAAMRNVAEEMGKPASAIEPLVPVDLVVDHSVMVDFYNTPDAVEKNMQMEFKRNGERYQFLKWGMQAFDTFKVVPPGFGIVHQVNLEYLFPGIQEKDGMTYPDTLVGTDSHTTMINALGVVGWGVGGIEAEAAMLGQPLYILTPDVVGVHLKGKLREGMTATDLVLTVTELLRKEKVVGKFVEFFGEGAEYLSLPDRATLSNMAPEYGATMGFFPVDETTLDYMRGTGRDELAIEACEAYFRAQEMFGIPKEGEIDYSQTIELDLDSVRPSLAGPKRPQDRIALPDMHDSFTSLFSETIAKGGFNKDASELDKRYSTSCPLIPVVNTLSPQPKRPLARNEVEMIDNRLSTPTDSCQTDDTVDLGHGDVLIAAITSCTNTSNPSVLLAAGLLAKKAVERGLSVHSRVKTSLAPGSRVVPEYLEAAGLMSSLEALGFGVTAFGCTTCIGNAGDLIPEYNQAIVENDIVAAAVLSGNRNFEARIHPNIRANFLASPPLVVAFALAGTVNIDMDKDPLGIGKDGQPVYLKDLWPSNSEIQALLSKAMNPAVFREKYSDFSKDNKLWTDIESAKGLVYDWPKSTYIAKPPFFSDFAMQPKAVAPISNARALMLLGDSVTTDHISPAGSFRSDTPAGQYLVSHDVQQSDFNTYGSRRGNHDVMIRGTFANVRVKNLMLPATEDGSRIEGGFTLLDGKQVPVYDAAMEYMQRGTPTIVFAGEEYGTGSSRDWAAKGTLLLGVGAVIAQSYERIHRSNLVGMGVLPLQFMDGASYTSLNIKGDETFSILGVDSQMQPRQQLTLEITRQDGSVEQVPLLSRIDTPIEVEYYRHGGILPYVLRDILANA
ncbi:MAG: aconitate hydratase [Pseudomonas sp.]|jgi:aconitate hydratase|nr:aconitate hydratase [Pseudomonas sp.]MDD2224364.1 aconitate hydratase [Pseudomonas sp.]MDY0414556.1 aconitate hydratase [Pseudomonas sp.]NLO55128.1 aconitate hydratase [Gammaproteobacteria bacterium]